MKTVRPAMSTSPPSSVPGCSTRASSRWRASTGTMASASPRRDGAPGRATTASSGTTTATSSRKYASGKPGSGSSTSISRPSARCASAYAACWASMRDRSGLPRVPVVRPAAKSGPGRLRMARVSMARRIARSISEEPNASGHRRGGERNQDDEYRFHIVDENETGEAIEAGRRGRIPPCAGQISSATTDTKTVILIQKKCRLPLALPADLSSWLGGFALCSARLLRGRRGLARCAGRSMRFSSRARRVRRFGHLVGGALERGLSLAGGVLHRSRHTLRGLSGPESELVQAIPNLLLLLRIHRGVEQL